jgi:hypothetical protein
MTNETNQNGIHRTEEGIIHKKFNIAHIQRAFTVHTITGRHDQDPDVQTRLEGAVGPGPASASARRLCGSRLLRNARWTAACCFTGLHSGEA